MSNSRQSRLLAPVSREGQGFRPRVIVAVAGGISGNFLQEAAVRILDALGAWWGS